jgi:hypothetical protein
MIDEVSALTEIDSPYHNIKQGGFKRGDWHNIMNCKKDQIINESGFLVHKQCVIKISDIDIIEKYDGDFEDSVRIFGSFGMLQLWFGTKTERDETFNMIKIWWETNKEDKKS